MDSKYTKPRQEASLAGPGGARPPKRILVHFRHKCLLKEFHNQWINHNAVDQKMTSASLGGGAHGPLPPLDSPVSMKEECLHSMKYNVM